jgi:hypothetical protein
MTVKKEAIKHAVSRKMGNGSLAMANQQAIQNLINSIPMS